MEVQPENHQLENSNQVEENLPIWKKIIESKVYIQEYSLLCLSNAERKPFRSIV